MSKKILLIEDDAWLREMYTHALTQDPAVVVLEAESAEKALKLLDNQTDISLIILDMFLSGHNGVEFLHEIASYDDVNTIPVVILSSVYPHDFGLTPERWKHYGVVKHLHKPDIRPERLLIEVKKLLTQKVSHEAAN